MGRHSGQAASSNQPAIDERRSVNYNACASNNPETQRHRHEFDALFVSILPALYPRVIAQCGSRDDADDTIQDLYVRLSGTPAWRRLLVHPNPAGYLMLAVTSLVRDRWRRRNRMRAALVRLAAQAVDEAMVESEDPDSHAAVASALNTLSRKEAAAILLVDIIGCSLGDAGIVLGVRKATVHNNRQRGLSRLRSGFARSGAETVA